MEHLIYLTILVVILPLIGAFWNVIVAGLLSAVALATLLGVMMIAPDGGTKIILASQIPAALVLSGLAFYFALKHNVEDLDKNIVIKKDEFRMLQHQYAELKKSVIESEKEEAASLQIYGVAKGLAEALSWKDMAPKLTSGIQKIFGAYEFLLYSIDDKGQWSQLHRRGGWEKTPPVTGELSADVTFYHPPRTLEVLPVLYIPIFSNEGDVRVIRGALFMKTSAEINEEKMISLGREFGSQLEMALNKALLFTQMEMHSRIDGLTGVLRRQAFMDRLDEEFKKAAAFHTQFCVLMVDIDHFKLVNDTHGHGAGDAVLTRMGQILKEAFYETDVVGRYGGEEFIILLPRAQKEGVIRKAENLRQRIEREVIKSGFGELKFTVSIGLSQYPVNGQRADVLIEKADQALYQAKETGRNRVIAA